MKTMQTAGVGTPLEFHRKQMHLAYTEARFEASMLRQALPYRSAELRARYVAQVRMLHNAARVQLRHLNALKAEVTP